MDYIQFASRIKEKHPSYANIGDEELVRKVIKKHPQYTNSFNVASLPNKQRANELLRTGPLDNVPPKQKQLSQEVLEDSGVEREKARAYYNAKDGAQYDDVVLDQRIKEDYGSMGNPEMANQLNAKALQYEDRGEVLTADRRSKWQRFLGRSAAKIRERADAFATNKELREEWNIETARQLPAIGAEASVLGKDFESAVDAGKTPNSYQYGAWNSKQDLGYSMAGSEKEALKKLQELDEKYAQAGPEPAEGFWGKGIQGFAGSAPAMLQSVALAPTGVGPSAFWQQQGAGSFMRTFVEGKDIDSIDDKELQKAYKVSQAMGVPYAAVELAVRSIPFAKGFGSSIDKQISNIVVDKVMKMSPSALEKVTRGGIAFMSRWILETLEEGGQGAITEEARRLLEKEGVDLGKLLDVAIEDTKGAAGSTLLMTMAGTGASLAIERKQAPVTLGDANVTRNTKTDAEIVEMVDGMDIAEEAKEVAVDAFLEPSEQSVSELNEVMFPQEEEVIADTPVDEGPSILEDEIDRNDFVGFSTAIINKERQRQGADALSEDDVKARQKSMDEALDQGLDAEAEALADRVLASEVAEGVKTYQMSDEEIAGLIARSLQIRNERIKISRDMKSAIESGDQDAIDQLTIAREIAVDKARNIEQALKTSTRASGRAASMLASVVNRFTYDVVSLEDAALTAKGEALTEGELADIQDVANQIELIEGEIDLIKEKLSSGKFEAKKGKVDKDLVDAKARLNALQRDARNKIYNLRAKTTRDKLKQVLTLPRSLMATADMSYGLRQGLLPSFAHPKIASKAWGNAFKSFFSQHQADKVDVALREHPLYEDMVGYGTHFSNIDSAISDREEFFASNLAEKIPMFGKVVMASERNMVTGLNMLRHGLMVDFLTKHPDTSTDAKKAYAKYVNIATGRGEAKVLDRAGEELSAIFFAPRFAVSRVQAPIEATKNIIQHPELRGEMIGQWAALAGTGMAVLALASLAGADVEDDPDSSDWGKIVIDNKHIDIFGGIQQPLRIAAKAIKAGVDRVQTGETDTDIITDVGRYLKYKLSPPVTMINELVTGRDVIGREVEPLDIGVAELPELATTLIKNTTPLILQSIVEAYQEGESPLVIAGLAAGEGLGLSIGVYDRQMERRAKPRF